MALGEREDLVGRWRECKVRGNTSRQAGDASTNSPICDVGIGGGWGEVDRGIGSEGQGGSMAQQRKQMIYVKRLI